MEPRRPRKSGRLWRRGYREPVPFGPGLGDGFGLLDDEGWGDGGDQDDWGGSAGVREPRTPKPFGPMTDAGEAVPPDPPLAARLPDPRY
jgi:hypothetical protein